MGNWNLLFMMQDSHCRYSPMSSCKRWTIPLGRRRQTQWNKSNKSNKSNNTISIENYIPDWPEKLAAAVNKENPTKVIVGAMVSGPMNLRRKPTNPLKPISIWNREATMMAPWICEDNRTSGRRWYIVKAGLNTAVCNKTQPTHIHTSNCPNVTVLLIESLPLWRGRLTHNL